MNNLEIDDTDAGLEEEVHHLGGGRYPSHSP